MCCLYYFHEYDWQACNSDIETTYKVCTLDKAVANEKNEVKA